MDKSLKKLSRIELLELMVDLSEDYEDLSAENARLKRMLASQRLPRSAKVGSIAEAALKANGYFESVQRSADEYLREIKHLRDELAIRSQDDYGRDPAAIRAANSQAQSLIRDAQMRADQIVSRAQAQAQAMLSDAQARSEEIVANANVQARIARPQGAHAQNPSFQDRSLGSVSDRTTQMQPQQRRGYYASEGGLS